MKKIFLLTISSLLGACAQPSGNESSPIDYSKKPYAICEGHVGAPAIHFKAQVSIYPNGSYVLETWSGPNNQYFIGFLDKQNYKGFFDFYVGSNIVVIRHFEVLLSDAEVAGTCTKL